MNIKNIILFAVLLIIGINIWKSELDDRCLPYGTYKEKLEIFKKKNNIDKLERCDENGKSVFWGTPNIKDSLKKSLDKIEWLSTNYQYEIIWRRTMIQAIFITLIIYLIVLDQVELGTGKIISVLAFCYCVILMLRNYDKYHVQRPKSKYITKNIHLLKQKLKIPHYNFLTFKDIDN